MNTITWLATKNIKYFLLGQIHPNYKKKKKTLAAKLFWEVFSNIMFLVSYENHRVLTAMHWKYIPRKSFQNYQTCQNQHTGHLSDKLGLKLSFTSAWSLFYPFTSFTGLTGLPYVPV